MFQYEETENFPFVGYIDTLSAIVLIFLLITAFTAIAMALNKEALREAQQEAEELRAALQQHQERLRAAGYQHIQEIPKRVEWRDAVLTKQVLENTGWAERVAELPMYSEWQQVKHLSPDTLEQLTESEQQVSEMQQTLKRYTNVLAQAGYADIAEIPPKSAWETSQLRLRSYQNLLEEVGFGENIDTLYDFLEQWNNIILEMKRIFNVKENEPESVLKKLRRLESLQKKVVIPVEQGSIFFEFGQTSVQDEFKQILDTHIEEARTAIKNGTYDLIQIEGHTDNIPVRSDNPSYNDNWELSTARAYAVLQYFIERGIPPDHLAVVGHGEYKPKVQGTDRRHLEQNRRIEIVFLNTSLLNLGIEE